MSNVLIISVNTHCLFTSSWATQSQMKRTVFFLSQSGLTGSETETPKEEESFRAHSCPTFRSKLCFNCWAVNFGRIFLLPYGE